VRRSEGQASPLQHPLRYCRTLSSYTSTFVVDLICLFEDPIQNISAACLRW
jgi:hypothetical protein